jgi:hypothetical protein
LKMADGTMLVEQVEVTGNLTEWSIKMPVKVSVIIDPNTKLLYEQVK